MRTQIVNQTVLMEIAARAIFVGPRDILTKLANTKGATAVATRACGVKASRIFAGNITGV
jgi:hypothetical protein